MASHRHTCRGSARRPDVWSRRSTRTIACYGVIGGVTSHSLIAVDRPISVELDRHDDLRLQAPFGRRRAATRAGSTPPRHRTSRITIELSRTGCTRESFPPRLPNAVRTALTTVFGRSLESSACRAQTIHGASRRARVSDRRNGSRANLQKALRVACVSSLVRVLTLFPRARGQLALAPRAQRSNCCGHRGPAL